MKAGGRKQSAVSYQRNLAQIRIPLHGEGADDGHDLGGICKTVAWALPPMARPLLAASVELLAGGF